MIDLLQEQRAPAVTFSVSAFSQLQCMAACLPQEHLASFAQMHPPSRPQQVAVGMVSVCKVSGPEEVVPGTTATGADMFGMCFKVS